MTGDSGTAGALRWVVIAAIAMALLWFGLRARAPKPASRAEKSEPGALTGSGATAEHSLAAAGQAASPPSGAAPGSPAAAPAGTPGKRPLSKIRIDYESEPRDAGAAAAEARIRAIFAAAPGAEGSLQQVSCTVSVCKIDARWSRELNRGYNAALVEVVKQFSKEMSFESGGPPEGMVMPMTIYVRRPGFARAPSPASQVPVPGSPQPP